MFNRVTDWLSICLVALSMAQSGCTACVKFDSLPTGTEWGTPAGHASGDLVHEEQGIKVYVQTHEYTTGVAFVRAYSDAPFNGPLGHSMRIDNINLLFDFGDVSFTPAKVELQFVDEGGHENLSVNGIPIISGELTSGSSGGIVWTVTDQPIPSGRKGTLVVEGPIQKLVIGGQEFWIDSVCAER